MIEKTVVIAALARDCAVALEKNISKIEELRKCFKGSYVVVVENDSKDGTKEILKQWSKLNNNIFIISNDFYTVTIPKQCNHIAPGNSYYRIEKMAYYRNMYMEFIDSLNVAIDYVIVIDVDIDYFSVNGVIDSLKYAPKDWAGLFAYGIAKVKIIDKLYIPCYYDSYAFWKSSKSSFHLTLKNYFHAWRYVTWIIFFKHYLCCNSAFSGIGIYKYELIRGKRYYCQKNQLNNSIEAICEHIPFNISLLDSEHKNYVSYKMKVHYREDIRFRSFAWVFIPYWLKTIYYKFKLLLK